MYVFIVNPISGNGRASAIWNQIEPILIERNHPYKVIFTQYPGHSTEAVLTLSPLRTKAVVAIGGDGTVHEVVNGLSQVKIPFGIIPAGSGNDYARAMKVPKDHLLALERILTGEKKKMDLLFVGEKWCTTVVGIGFDGKVAEVANRSVIKKWLNALKLGKFTYFFIVLKVLLQYRPTKVTITIDGTSHIFDGVWLIAVANNPYYGGGMFICPEAQSDDGLLDVCIVHNVTKLQLLKVFPKVFKGNHITHSAFSLMKGSTVSVSSDIPIVIHGDGEIIGETPIEVSIRKDGLDIV
ncbi:diacylglycerol/lipid kinase family protein [Bacillus alkalicellulosilyticus]|uniref:diacylglycerol/lipid kinase family protein n=1 Tax=Alkalihalobacterium alkalicellulosilyticum TaxID=1912214 RepID=UPI0009968FFF|nr:diacylglycerol kinase family protein [Bacillus alkalicellulosilyticus]